MPSAHDMEAFWDARAREDALFFVDDRVPYRRADAEEFFREGERLVDTIFGVVGLSPDATSEVVEIGCGVGRLTRALARRFASVRALDVSAEMLQRARTMNPELANVDWVHGDGATLGGIETASADGVFSHVVFQHIPDPQVTLGYVREMGRVLRPGGWAVFQISNDREIHQPGPIGWRRRVKELLGRSPRGRTDPAWIGSAVDLDDLRATAQEAGMTAERITGAGTQFCLVALRRNEVIDPTGVAGGP